MALKKVNPMRSLYYEQEFCSKKPKLELNDQYKEDILKLKDFLGKNLIILAELYLL